MKMDNIYILGLMVKKWNFTKVFKGNEANK